MAIVSLSPLASLQVFLALKAEMEIEKQGHQASILSFRQKRSEPAPSASNPALQMKLNKAYRAYQNIILDIINIYQDIENLCQNQIAFLEHTVAHMSTSQIEINVSHVLESFRSQIEPLENQALQLQRSLQAERAAMIILTHDRGRV